MARNFVVFNSCDFCGFSMIMRVKRNKKSKKTKKTNKTVPAKKGSPRKYIRKIYSTGEIAQQISPFTCNVESCVSDNSDQGYASSGIEVFPDPLLWESAYYDTVHVMQVQ